MRSLLFSIPVAPIAFLDPPIIPTGYHGHCKGVCVCVCVDGPDIVLPIQLNFQDLPYSVQVFGCGLLVVPICLRDPKLFVAVLNTCDVAFWEPDPLISVDVVHFQAFKH